MFDLVVVFNNGVVHRVKNCSEFTRPSCGYLGDVKTEKAPRGLVLDLKNVSFYYFEKIEED